MPLPDNLARQTFRLRSVLTDLLIGRWHPADTVRHPHVICPVCFSIVPVGNQDHHRDWHEALAERLG